jgi:hypothetical protein
VSRRMLYFGNWWRRRGRNDISICNFWFHRSRQDGGSNLTPTRGTSAYWRTDSYQCRVLVGRWEVIMILTNGTVGM